MCLSGYTHQLDLNGGVEMGSRFRLALVDLLTVHHETSGSLPNVSLIPKEE